MSKRADKDSGDTSKVSVVESDEAMLERGFDRWLNRQLHRIYDPVLSEAVPDEALRRWYRELFASEARHYRTLLDEERRHADRAAGLAASYALFLRLLADKGLAYDEFVLGL